jgi:alanine racemase
MANSAAVLRDPRTHFDLVRPGIALFGVDPTSEIPSEMRGAASPSGRFKPTMSVLSRIVSVRDLSAGDATGYGGTFVAREATRVATIPMGYADGLPRLVSNRGAFLVRGMRAPIVGNVSMDMTMVDVTHIPGADVGDDAVILGSQKGPHGTDTILASELASWADTIPWEILTNISRRVPRFYREA